MRQNIIEEIDNNSQEQVNQEESHQNEQDLGNDATDNGESQLSDQCKTRTLYKYVPGKPKIRRLSFNDDTIRNPDESIYEPDFGDVNNRRNSIPSSQRSQLWKDSSEDKDDLHDKKVLKTEAFTEFHTRKREAKCERKQGNNVDKNNQSMILKTTTLSPFSQNAQGKMIFNPYPNHPTFDDLTLNNNNSSKRFKHSEDMSKTPQQLQGQTTGFTGYVQKQEQEKTKEPSHERQ